MAACDLGRPLAARGGAGILFFQIKHTNKLQLQISNSSSVDGVNLKHYR